MPFRRIATVLAIAVGALAISATAATAHVLVVDLTATCGCVYTVHASGITEPNANVVVNYSFTVTSLNVDYPVSGQVQTTSDGNGNFDVTIPDLPLPGDCAKALLQQDVVTFKDGVATLITNGSADPSTWANLPGPIFGDDCPIPEGKSFSIGPQSMEGHLLIRAGDWISGGYSFVFVNGSHPATTVTVTSTLTFPYKCADGTMGTFAINLGTHSYNVPAFDKSWQPTGDANSVLSWAGSGQAPAVCGPGGVIDNSKGALFQTTVLQTPDTGSMLNWRFKYRDPNAKGKGNVNCLDTSDPRRDKADVCGASWSATVRDP
jgi:hypothetical protein